jgi:hypothetical protein
MNNEKLLMSYTFLALLPVHLFKNQENESITYAFLVKLNIHFSKENFSFKIILRTIYFLITL